MAHLHYYFLKVCLSYTVSSNINLYYISCTDLTAHTVHKLFQAICMLLVYLPYTTFWLCAFYKNKHEHLYSAVLTWWLFV